MAFSSYLLKLTRCELLSRFTLICVVIFSGVACSKLDDNVNQVQQVQAEPYKLKKANGNGEDCEFLSKENLSSSAVFASGAYSGRLLGFQIDSSGHYATEMDVVVNYTKKPVVLMLGAYEPTIWNVSWTKKSNIVGVLLSGYHRQVVTGLLDSTPTLISTFENKVNCAYFYIEPKPNRLRGLNSISKRLFKRNVDMVYLAKHGSVTIGDTLDGSEKVLQSASAKPTDYRQESLSGIARLEQAVGEGVLKKATLVNAVAWVEEVAKKRSVNKSIPPVKGMDRIKPPRPMLLNAFVVLQSFSYPDGLYGANAATFFILKGVPRPKGQFGHSTVYDFNTLTCLGGGCVK